MVNFDADFGQSVDRTDATNGYLIPPEITKEIFKEAVQGSQVLPKLRRLADMPTKVRTMPVLNSLPIANFVGGEPDDANPQAYKGLIKTTKQDWKNVSLTAENLGVIVPIPNDVIDDAAGDGYNLFGEVRPQIAEAIAVAIDQAILFGTNKPTSWPAGILVDAIAKGKTVAIGTGADLYQDILAENGVFDLVNQSGYGVSSCLGALTMMGKLRGTRDADGRSIFNDNPTVPGTYNLWGVPSTFPTTGIIDPAVALLIAGAWDQLVFAFRRDLTWSIADQGVIQDASGAIQYNLFQQEMTAIKVTTRLAWQRPNPINRVDQTANRYPFACLIP
jgi:HK97 family phage major capsid protein